MRISIAHRASGVVATYRCHIVGEVVVTSRAARATMSGTVTVMPKVVVMMMVMRMIPIVVVPAPVIAVPVIGTVPIIVIIPWVVKTIVGIMIVIVIMVRIEAPIPRVAHINIGVATAVGVAGVIVVVVIHRGAGTRSETLDAGREVGIVVGLGSGVNHAVGIGHRLGGLIHGFGVGLVVLAVGIISLVVVSAIAIDARRNGTVGLLPARRVVRRVVGVVVSHPFVRGTAGDGEDSQHDGDNSNCFHFVAY